MQHPTGSALALREYRLRKVLAMLDNKSAVSVKELASAMSISPDHLERVFKKETGQQLHDRVVESRLQRAAYLLATTEFEIKEIAFAVGYRHPSSFVRAFTRRFAASPHHYRLKKAS